MTHKNRLQQIPPHFAEPHVPTDFRYAFVHNFIEKHPGTEIAVENLFDQLDKVIEGNDPNAGHVHFSLLDRENSHPSIRIGAAYTDKPETYNTMIEFLSGLYGVTGARQVESRVRRNEKIRTTSTESFRIGRHRGQPVVFREDISAMDGSLLPTVSVRAMNGVEGLDALYKWLGTPSRRYGERVDMAGPTAVRGLRRLSALNRKRS